MNAATSLRVNVSAHKIITMLFPDTGYAHSQAS